MTSPARFRVLDERRITHSYVVEASLEEHVRSLPSVTNLSSHTSVENISALCTLRDPLQHGNHRPPLNA